MKNTTRRSFLRLAVVTSASLSLSGARSFRVEAAPPSTETKPSPVSGVPTGAPPYTVILVRSFATPGATEETTKQDSEFAEGLAIRINERANKIKAANEVVAVYEKGAKGDKGVVSGDHPLVVIEGELSQAPDSGSYLCEARLYFDDAGAAHFRKLSIEEKNTRLFARWSAMSTTSRALSDAQVAGIDREGVIGELAGRILYQARCAFLGQGQRLAGELRLEARTGTDALLVSPPGVASAGAASKEIAVASRWDGDLWCVGFCRNDRQAGGERWTTVPGSGAKPIKKDAAPISIPFPLASDEVWLVLRTKQETEGNSAAGVTPALAPTVATAGSNQGVQVIECLSGVGSDLGVIRLYKQLHDGRRGSWHALCWRC